jgi:hypothetical protein
MKRRTLRRGRAGWFLLCLLVLATAGICAQTHSAGPAPLVATAFDDVNPSQPHIAIQQTKIPRIERDHFARTYLGDGLLGIRPNPNSLSQSETVAARYVFSSPTGGVEMAAPAPQTAWCIHPHGWDESPERCSGCENRAANAGPGAREGLIVNAELLQANGRAERDAALVMLEQVGGDGRITVGGDKGFDTAEFVEECRHMNATPHVAQNTSRPGGSAIDARTTRHAGYGISQKKRKRIEECFGWLKDIALLRKLKQRRLFKLAWIFTFAAAAYNLVRMRKLIPIQAAA